MRVGGMDPALAAGNLVSLALLLVRRLVPSRRRADRAIRATRGGVRVSKDFMTARRWIAHMRSILDGKAGPPPGQQTLEVGSQTDDVPPECGADPFSEQIRSS